jgi:hypothetical protein
VRDLGIERNVEYGHSASGVVITSDCKLKSLLDSLDFLRLGRRDVEEFLGRLWVSSRTSGLIAPLIRGAQLLFEVLSRAGSDTYTFLLVCPKLRPAICSL